MNTAIYLKIDLVDEVKQFVDLCQSKSYGIKAHQGSLCVDCKSLLGMFAIDTTKPFKIVFSVSQSVTECKCFDKWKVVGDWK